MKNFRNATHRLAVLGLAASLTALLAALTNLYILPGVRAFSFAYLPGAIISATYGPFAGALVGATGDVIGYLANPNGGAFHPGFTISAVITNLIYAQFLYRPTQPYGLRSQTIRIFLAQITILVVVSLGLNMYWLQTLFGWSAGELYTWLRITPKLIQFPIDLFLTTLCLNKFRLLKKTTP